MSTATLSDSTVQAIASYSKLCQAIPSYASVRLNPGLPPPVVVVVIVVVVAAPIHALVLIVLILVVVRIGLAIVVVGSFFYIPASSFCSG